jgi:hypothetical protein
MADLAEELFGGEDLQLKPIQVDEEEYQKAILPLYARLQIIDHPTTENIADEVIEATKESDTLSYICDKPGVLTKFECDPSEVKYTTKVEFGARQINVVAPRREWIIELKIKLHRYLHHLEDQIEDMEEFTNVMDWRDKAKEFVKSILSKRGTKIERPTLCNVSFANNFKVIHHVRQIFFGSINSSRRIVFR